MTLADLMSGPDWIMGLVFAVLLLFTIVLLSGHGSRFIAGYNIASKEVQMKYNKKKLCKVVGGGMAIISVLILIIGLFAKALPAYSAYVFSGVIIVDAIVVIIWGNTICKM